MTSDFCEAASALLDRAISRFEQERYHESNQLMLDFIARYDADSYSFFCIARNFLYMRDFDNSEIYFKKSLDHKEVFRWSYYEMGRLFSFISRKVEAADQMILFLKAGSYAGASVDLKDAHIDCMIAIAHGAFEVDRSKAGSLYIEICRTGFRDYLTELRSVETLLDSGLITEAEDQMKRLRERHKLDAWGTLAYSRVQSAIGNPNEAIEAIKEALLLQPNNNDLRLAGVHQFLEREAFAEATALIRELESANNILDYYSFVVGPRFRLAVLQKDYESLKVMCRTPDLLQSIPSWVSVEALFKFALPGEQITRNDIDVANELADFFFLKDQNELGEVLALYQYFSRRRLWSKIASLEERIKEADLYHHPEVLMRRFENLCAMAQMEQAREFYHEYYHSKKLGQWEACVVLRFLAEAKMWNECGDLLVDFISEGFFFPDGDYFLLRICRKASIHEKIIGLLRGGVEPQPKQHGNLLRLLTDDLLLGEAKRSQFPLTHQISAANRLLFKCPVSPDAKLTVAFLCADQAYFFSLLTCLVSACAEGGDELAWYVFLARDIPHKWIEILSRVRVSLSIDLQWVTEDCFVESGAVHIENYGIFTGGNTLSRAAFLRIYAAKFLLENTSYARALYIDTDIIVNKHLALAISSLHFRGASLMARLEEPSPEVQSVIERHGLEEASYFNSGVLYFDFESTEVKRLLEEAIHLSEHHSDRLVFHDQCALNIAFAGQVRHLTPSYNYFLRPHRPDNGDFTCATLIHFLDKPKPWDLSYSREYRRLWMKQAGVVRMLLTSGQYADVVAAANA